MLVIVCDNQAALHITSISYFPLENKHTNCSIIRENIQFGDISASFVNSNYQPEDVSTIYFIGPQVIFVTSLAYMTRLISPS